MASKHFKTSLLLITAIILTLGLSISLQSLLAAYTAPLANPATCLSGNPGCDAPINVSSNSQSMAGSLGVVGAFAVGDNSYFAGKVGIGTTTPGAKLQINPPASTEGLRIVTASNYSPLNIRNNADNADIFRVSQSGDISVLKGVSYTWPTSQGAANTVLTNNGSGGLTWSAATGGGGQWATSGTNIYNSNTGNVGIGTTGPSAPLTVKSQTPASYPMKILNSSGNTIAGVLNYASGGGQLLVWDQSGNTKVSIGSDPANNYIMNNVGIGTTNPSYKLDIYPSSGFTGNLFRVASSTGTAGNGLVVTNAGNVGIGTTNPGEKLEVNGNVKATAFFYSSDQRLKTDINPLYNQLEKALKLQAVSFRWKSNQKQDIGLIAQDVEKEFPELVATNGETGFKSVDYGKLSAILLEALKEQQEQIEELKVEMEKLKN